MSGIVAAALSGGCCCRPQEGCTCSDPNRPGALVDASITAISIEAELGRIHRFRDNKRDWCGECPCDGLTAGTWQGPVWGTDPAGPYFVYVSNGCIVDPDFVDGTECEAFACKAAGCACCPEYRIGVNFGNQVLERVNQFPFTGWATVFRSVSDHGIGQWNWQPQQVGYCIDQNSLPLDVRVRRSCFFVPKISGRTALGPDVDPNGQYLDIVGNYSGGNVGVCGVYAAASVTSPSVNGCYYEAQIRIFYEFQSLFAGEIAQQGQVIIGGSAVYTYRKPCLSPSDTVMGTYQSIGAEPSYSYSEDQECGPRAVLYEFDETPPQTITIS